MLDFFGYEDWGKRILNAIEAVLVEKTALTPDLGGTAKTSQMTDCLLERL